MAAAPLPPGPSAPRWLQTMRWWTRPVPFFERCRARYGQRFTVRLVATPPFVMLAVLERVAPRVAGDGRLELSRRRSIALSPREGAEVVLV